MAAVDSVSVYILLGALLALVGIISSLVALRFGAPLLLVFLIIGMLAGEGGPGGIQFDDVRTIYLVGSITVALFLFDSGLRTRFATFRNMLAPALTLATVGVVLTAVLTAPVARYMLGMSWAEALLVGVVVASTDAAAVFLLVNARGLRLRPRVGATLEVESGTNNPFTVVLTLLLLEYLTTMDQSFGHVLAVIAEQVVLGTIIGALGGRSIVSGLNRLRLPQGVHAPFVATGALVIFGVAEVVHASGFLAVYLAGLTVGSRPTRAHNTVVVLLDTVSWLAQIMFFILLGLVVWPQRLIVNMLSGLALAATLILFARPVTVFLCLAPFRYFWREKAFISWAGLRGGLGIFLASIPLLIGQAKAYLYFDIAFVVVLTSLLIQGWTIAWAARKLHIALPRHDHLPRRGEQELVGYPVSGNSPYLKRGLLPAWARPILVVRDGKPLSSSEAQPVQPGDYVYLLASPEKAPTLDPFFIDMLPWAGPAWRRPSDFFSPGT